MDNDIPRLRRLAGLDTHNGAIMDDDEVDAMDTKLYDERVAREKKIMRLIQRAFERIGLNPSPDDGVSYTEDDREATVTLNDSDVDVTMLARLHKTGLADRYVVSATSYALDIVFTVKPELDHAV